ncbi:MAG: phosphate regulon sensor histidine kinase PhoR [Rugosibacter sp.]|nr:phosphate regulon sensor histidine kinase PhoR [Rugosibacter sp.]
MKPVVSEALATLIIVLAAALIGAWGWGALGASVMALCVLSLTLLRHLWWLGQLIHWVQAPQESAMPTVSGVWGELCDHLYQQMRKATKETKLVTTELERLRLAAEVLPEGVVILDDHRVIEWMNWEAEACFGLNAATDIGSRLTHLLREPALLDYLNNTTQSAKPLKLITQRNPKHTLQVQTVPFAAGRTLLMVRDVTQLEKLATMRRDFVANVSHELKTPLTVTLGFIETAADALGDASPDEMAHYLRMASEQASRMQSLIEDLLMLSSLETDSPPTESDVDLSALFAGVCEEARVLSAGQQNIRLTMFGPSHLVGSPRELHSVFSNLVTNAVRYTPKGGEIALHWDAGAHGGRFSVTDSGIGIAPEHLPRLTERFYRVDHGRSREMGGTGLGLAIVKHVLERHQAQLDIDSEPGKGSTFTAIFPAHRVR